MHLPDKKADFSNVTSTFESTEEAVPKADFSNVTSTFESTEEIVGETTYTIEKGDTLSAIAERHYGKANAWRRIFDANRDVIDDPDRIFPGQVITLPPKDEA